MNDEKQRRVEHRLWLAESRRAQASRTLTRAFTCRTRSCNCMIVDESKSWQVPSILSGSLYLTLDATLFVCSLSSPTNDLQRQHLSFSLTVFLSCFLLFLFSNVGSRQCVGRHPFLFFFFSFCLILCRSVTIPKNRDFDVLITQARFPLSLSLSRLSGFSLR